MTFDRKTRQALKHAIQRKAFEALETTRWGQGARPSQVKAAAKNMVARAKAAARKGTI